MRNINHTTYEQMKQSRMQPKKYKKYEGRGLSGIANGGNTCYMNACLSVLSHTYELNDMLDNQQLSARRDALTQRKSNSVLLNEWDALRSILWNQNCTVSPRGFVAAVQRVAHDMNNAEFQGWDQSDTSEFLLFMFDAFHNAYARPVVMRVDGSEKNSTDAIARQCYEMLKERYSKDYSECLDVFYGIQLSVISEPNTNDALSAKPEPFSVINLTIPTATKKTGGGGGGGGGGENSITLYDCFDAFCEHERIDGENAWFNSNTNQKQAVDKYIGFWSLPEIMVINLKRFVPTARYGVFKKNASHISIPLDGACFSKYVCGYNPEKYVYDLYGVCNHHGSIGGGHYTATVRVADGRWFIFDDSRVSEATNLTHLDGSAPYCLFYRRRQFRGS